MNLKIRHKIYLGMFSLLLLLGLTLFGVVSRIMTHALMEENRHRGLALGANLAARMTEPLLAMDLFRMRTLAEETVQLGNDIFYIFVLNSSGEPLVHTFNGGFPVQLKTANAVNASQSHHIRLLDTGHQMISDYALPIRIGEDHLGTVRLGLMRTRIQEAIWRLRWSVFLSTGLVILLAGFVGAALSRTLTRRINLLHRSSREVLRGNLSVTTSPQLPKNCWEIMACRKADCPAYGKAHQRCWYVAGTRCPQCLAGDYAQKERACRQCQVYRKCSGDELQGLAEIFNCMTRVLGGHLDELSQAKQTLTEQRQLLRTVLDASPDVVSLMDDQFRYRAVNKAFCKWVGRSEADILGKNDFDLFREKIARKYRHEDRRVMERGITVTVERRMPAKPSEKWLHVVKIPVLDAAGQVIGRLFSGRDVTQSKQIQEQLTQAQKMEATGRLTAGIAHEINTPLGIILGYTQLMIQQANPDTQMHADLKLVEKHTKNCRKIVSDLLRFSRRTKSEVLTFDVNDAVEEAISVVQHTLEMDRVLIEAIYADESLMIKGELEKLKQVFINLLGNAHDAIGRAGQVHVTTRRASVNNNILVTVADTGCGIAADKLDQVFDPFFTTKPAGKGTGLGLAVTFGIIQAHGGKITVESPPTGMDEAFHTAFYIVLPAAEPATGD